MIPNPLSEQHNHVLGNSRDSDTGTMFHREMGPVSGLGGQTELRNKEVGHRA